MSTALKEQEQLLSRLAALYRPVAAELAECERMLGAQLRSDDPSVDEMARHGFRMGGKRLRPALLLLSAKACGKLVSEHLSLAVVMEMLHTASLVHDDVLDEASVRRHLATANARWGNKSSILLGDYLFTHAFFLASSLGSIYACQTIGRSTNILCEGEMRQIGTRGRYDLSEQEYLSIIDAKTAELCACCCQLGAHFAGANAATTDRLQTYGRLLGLAFQVVDDLLDVVGDEATAGKSLGTDLEQGKPTLPVIHALQLQPEARRRELIEQLTDPEADRQQTLRELLQDGQALDYTRQMALRFTAQAREQLVGLEASESRDVLESITQFVVERTA